MTKFFRILFQLSWALGVLAILAAVVLRFGNLRMAAWISPRGGLEFAIALFLCALATREMERT